MSTKSCTTVERLVTPGGTVWTLREIGSDGDGRYAPEGVTVRHRLTLESGARLVSEEDARPEAPRSQVPDLSARVGVTHLRGVLRVDAIQRRTLLEMAAAWNEQGAEDDIVSSMTVLADTVAGDPSEGEEGAAVEALAEAAMLQGAEVELTLSEAVRLRSELDAVIEKLSRGKASRVVGAVRSVERAA